MKILDGLGGFATSEICEAAESGIKYWRYVKSTGIRNALLFHDQKSLVWQSHENWWFRQFAFAIFRGKEVPLCLAVCVLEHG
jgi:hypothetical protein